MTREDIIRLAIERKVRIVIIGGFVYSKTDGESHYVGSMQLMQLYRIPNSVPVTVYPSSEHEYLCWFRQPNDIVLEPKFDGDYSFDGVSIRARGNT